MVNVEPFANVSYVNFENNRINEQGGATALHGDKQHTDATFSTLGLRSGLEWDATAETTVSCAAKWAGSISMASSIAPPA